MADNTIPSQHQVDVVVFSNLKLEKFLFDFFNLPVVVNIETNDFCREFP